MNLIQVEAYAGNVVIVNQANGADAELMVLAVPQARALIALLAQAVVVAESVVQQ